jgi:hypothetical protein
MNELREYKIQLLREAAENHLRQARELIDRATGALAAEAWEDIGQPVAAPMTAEEECAEIFEIYRQLGAKAPGPRLTLWSYVERIKQERDEARSLACHWRDIAAGAFAKAGPFPWEGTR